MPTDNHFSKTKSLIKDAPSKPTGAQRKKFCSLWCSEAVEAGLVPETADVLFSGLRFHPGEALLDYCGISGVASPEAALFFVTQADALRDAGPRDRRSPFGVLLSFLAALLNTGELPQSLGPVLTSAAGIALQEETWAQNAPAVYRDYFLDDLQKEAGLPSLSGLSMSEADADQVRAVFSALQDKVRGTVSGRKKKALDRVDRWLAEPAPAKSASAGASAPPEAGHERSVPSLLSDLASAFEALQEENDRLRMIVNSAQEEPARIEEVPRSGDVRLRKKYDDLQAEHEDLARQHEDIARRLAEAVSRSERAEQERDQKADLIQAMQRDASVRLTEQMHALEDRLQREYNEFEDVRTAEMSIVLGENLRDQLADVFDLLKKNGFAFRRRG